MSFSKEMNKKGVLQIIIFPPANAQLIITIVCCVCASVYYIIQLALLHSLAVSLHIIIIIYVCILLYLGVRMHEFVLVLACWMLAFGVIRTRAHRIIFKYDSSMYALMLWEPYKVQPWPLTQLTWFVSNSFKFWTSKFSPVKFERIEKPYSEHRTHWAIDAHQSGVGDKLRSLLIYKFNIIADVSDVRWFQCSRSLPYQWHWRRTEWSPLKWNRL